MSNYHTLTVRLALLQRQIVHQTDNARILVYIQLGYKSSQPLLRFDGFMQENVCALTCTLRHSYSDRVCLLHLFITFQTAER